MDNKETKSYRNLVVGVDTPVPLSNGKYVTAINFDNAATTPPLISVMQKIINFAPWYSSVHRGTGYKSKLSSDLYDKSRLTVLNFVNADIHDNTVIYVKNTTEAINKLSYRLCQDESKSVILSTDMEHHSNDLPWRNKYYVDYIDIDASGRLLMEDMERKLHKYDGAVKLVTITGASNVTGYVNPIYEAAALAHKYNASILVDGAQLVPHLPVNMMPEDPKRRIDYLAFSAHKMYAPFGIGVLIGPKKTFMAGEPDYKGGGTVKMVTHDYIEWDDPPSKDEAGTPNIMGVAALTAAINTLIMIGMKNIAYHEKCLTEYALLKFKTIPGIRLYGNTVDCSDRVGIIPFNIKGVYHGAVAKMLSSEAGISVRSGCFCAQPYIQRLLKLSREEIESYKNNPNKRPGMVRISFGLYNNKREIDRLIYALQRIAESRKQYNEGYSLFIDHPAQ